MEVIFIILFIDITFALLFDDFSIHIHSFISKQSFIILVQKSLLFYHTHVYKTISSFIWIKEVAFISFTHVCADLLLCNIRLNVYSNLLLAV